MKGGRRKDLSQFRCEVDEVVFGRDQDRSAGVVEVEQVGSTALRVAKATFHTRG